MNTRAGTLLLAVTLAFSACQAESPSAPARPNGADGQALSPSSLSLPSPRSLPLRGACEATSTRVTAFNPPLLHQVATAECEISHLGRLSIVNVQSVNVATGQQSGQATWRTASGDELHATSLGWATPTDATAFRFTGVTTLEGGTGRFSDASGTLHVAGTGDTATGTGSFTFIGTVTYGASARADR